MPGDYDMDAVRTLAREWIDRVNASTGLSGGWRLQVLQFRTRRRFGPASGYAPAGPSPDAPDATDVNGDRVALAVPDGAGECPDLPLRIRRFVSGIPWALVDQAVRYLYEIAPYTGIVYNGVKLDGVYRPTVTTWTRDAAAQTGQDATYTLTQDLIELTDCDGAETVPSGASCTSSETTTYHWDESYVSGVPSSCCESDCGQGVTYEVRGVNRKEDGTFDYQVVRSAAVTQHFGPVTVECGPAATTTSEKWANLYGSPGAFRAEGCGPVPLPPADLCPGCSSSRPGVRRQVNVSQNRDCTYDVEIRVRTSCPLYDEWTDGTACRPVLHRSWDGLAEDPTGDPSYIPEPAPGERVGATVRRGEDGTWTLDVSVASAEEPYSYGWTDGSPCRPSATDVYRSWPENPLLDPSVYPPEPPAGAVRKASLSRNDDCTWDASVTVTEPPAPFVAEWDEGTPCQPTHVRFGQNEAEPPAATALGEGFRVSRRVSRNDDCTYDSTVSVTDMSAGAWTQEWTQGSECRPERVTEFSGLASPPPIPAASGGRTVRARVSRDADCLYSGTVTVAEPAAADLLEWEDGSPCKRRSHRYWQNWASVPPVSGGREPGKTVTVSLSRGDDCLYTAKEEVVEDEPADFSWTDGSACVRREIRSLSSQEAFEIPAAEPGESVNASVSRADDCTYTYSYSVTSYEPRDITKEWVSTKKGLNDICYYKNTLRLFSHLKEFPEIPFELPNTEVNVHMNDDCTFSGSIRSQELIRCDQPGGGGYSRASHTYETQHEYRVVNGVQEVRRKRLIRTAYDGLPTASEMVDGHDSVTMIGRFYIFSDWDVSEWYPSGSDNEGGGEPPSSGGSSSGGSSSGGSSNDTSSGS